MKIELSNGEQLVIKPQPIFAFIKIFPIILIVAILTYLAFEFITGIICLSLIFAILACYRYFYIRHINYTLTTGVLRISRGIFFKRVEQVELYRIKDYVMIQPPVLQLFRILELMLKTTDPENPVIWLRGIPQSTLVDILRDRIQETASYNKIVEIN